MQGKASGARKARSRNLDRREVLRLGALTALGCVTAKPAVAAALVRRVPRQRDARERSLRFYNLHTDERLRTVYWADGSYVPESLAEVDYILRDFRADKVHRIDPSLLDLLYALHGSLETHHPFDIISGYRTPKTNAMLAAHSPGVALHSLHMKGMAVDIRVPGRSTATLRNAALKLRLGGVGYYPVSCFVHIDVGRVRRWHGRLRG